ncbi:sulfotransferase [Catelliglobosispora koreensis]|uniref:sulfotransferase n=1 Tax=Catelliglobosispora koreensis TaxID=129052 RepID=UPI00036EE132|nr:sulfotransferase [Catelliglobosispora koreensis]
MTRALFITGFNRSGTTLITSAATEAAGGATLTVGYLARHMPKVDAFLKAAESAEIPPDRGVDRLPVTPSTPEEYGWLLAAKTGQLAFGFRAAKSRVLHQAVDEIGAEANADTVVLKNPWDTGKEGKLLDAFAGSRVIIVRRQLSAIENSLSRAWERMASNNAWVQALMDNPDFAAQIGAVLADPEARAKMVDDSRAKMRADAKSLADSVASLPLDRTAFVSYDELRADPRAGAAWLSHLLDADAFAASVSANTFPEFNQTSSDDELDTYWADSWNKVRQQQIEAGILTAPK